MVGAAILEVVFPIFLLAGIGYGWVKRGIPFDIAFITRLALDFAIPCLVFGKMATTAFEPGVFWALAGSMVTLYVALGTIFAVLLLILRMPLRDFLLPLVSANTGNIGLPLCLFAFGEPGLIYGIVIFATTVVLQFTLGLWLVSGEASPLKVLRNPLLLAAIFGILFSWTEITIPTFIANALALAGQPAIPLMLLALGASIAALPLVFPTRSIVLAILKLVLSAGLAAGIATMMGLEDVAWRVFVLQAITPVAVTTYMLAERYGRSPGDVAQLVMVSTVLVALTLPIALILLL